MTDRETDAAHRAIAISNTDHRAARKHNGIVFGNSSGTRNGVDGTGQQPVKACHCERRCFNRPGLCLENPVSPLASGPRGVGRGSDIGAGELC